MHRRILQEFERICSERAIRGSVLEVGAVPTDESLLCMKSLEHATEKIGIDLNSPSEYKDFKIVQGNANAMEFDDNRFDAVLCNAVLEHDKYFWKTVQEIKRVTKAGGLIVFGVPGYTAHSIEKLMRLGLAHSAGAAIGRPRKTEFAVHGHRDVSSSQLARRLLSI